MDSLSDVELHQVTLWVLLGFVPIGVLPRTFDSSLLTGRVSGQDVMKIDEERQDYWNQNKWIGGLKRKCKKQKKGKTDQSFEWNLVDYSARFHSLVSLGLASFLRMRMVMKKAREKWSCEKQTLKTFFRCARKNCHAGCTSNNNLITNHTIGEQASRRTVKSDQSKGRRWDSKMKQGRVDKQWQG